MQVLDLSELSSSDERRAITIGFFDGVHLGHRAVLRVTAMWRSQWRNGSWVHLGNGWIEADPGIQMPGGVERVDIGAPDAALQVGARE